MAVEELLKKLGSDEQLKKNIVAWKTLPSQPARFTGLIKNIHPELARNLEKEGIERLYLHQREAAEMALQGKNIVVATPTASGKTLCYNLPVIQTLLTRPGATALYLFPTKALAQDQVAGFMRLSAGLNPPLKAMTYDGDTPASARKIIRQSGDVVVTNPYMLHAGIMPNHTRWVRFFQGLAYVVIDEVHTLTGVFGSHVANLMRRLQRICRHYRSDPVYLLSSATLSNPVELGSALISKPMLSINDDGSPKGEKHFIFYNPPIVNAELGLRRSSLEEARRLAALCCDCRIQALTFCRSRTGVEVMTKYLKDHFERKGIDLSRLRAYRGGYLPLLRRQIEKGLRAGEIDAVVATNALELGIDIGSLDACILTGYPGSVASTLQQAGRSGRKAGPSLALIVGKSNATDQFVLHNPGYVLDQAPEAGAIDPDNLIIRVNQMKCAAFELPFRDGETFACAGTDSANPESTREILDFLARDARVLRKAGDCWHWMSHTFPAEEVSLHAGDMDNFTIFDRIERQVIGEVDRGSAMSLIHEGAIYGHQGEQFIIEELDYDNRRAVAARVDSDYYTEADLETDIQVQHINQSIEYTDMILHRGEIGVTQTATLFKKIRFYTRENLGTGPIHLPPESMHTEALFLTFNPSAADRLGLFEGGRAGALNGFSKLFHRVVPLYVRCDAADLGTKAEVCSKHFNQPTVTLFDQIPGGVGLSETASRLLPRIFFA
ncbi:MAG: DEAD/DEAH box helicase, partial [Planctomycetota bacterium]